MITNKNMDALLTGKLTELQLLCEKYNVKTLYVFGSACNGKFGEQSDLDFLISFGDISIEEYTDSYFELHYKLEHLFNRKIDLLTENSLSNPFLIESINETKQLLYAA
ncbi:MAG: nucleotidyltransferase domain-containing protein [Ignavibacteriales bacterium]|nr:nucleotidyltransferase domain-containing protein [Ignavibacteriales bacterium]MCF8438552.1 nucleotidyltransferase domain-containing protein [Ignavibacteriales bacterium]